MKLTRVALFSVFAALSVGLVACSAAPDASHEGTGRTSQASVDDIRSMTRRTDGNYDVVCSDGHAEIVSARQIRDDEVCRTATTPTTCVPRCNSRNSAGTCYSWDSDTCTAD